MDRLGTRTPTTAEHATTARHTWVLPEQRIVFTSLAKNACTSIKWLLADVTGQDTAAFARSSADESTRRLLIHDRRLWSGVPRLSDLDGPARARISPDQGWFVFAVVRDPRLRAWSAWQSKFLIRDSVYCRRFPDPSWLPRIPQSADEVIEDFGLFARHLTTSDDPVLQSDTHFRPQTESLAEDAVPYSRIYDISELADLLTDLGTHLESVGQPTPVELTRDNDTPLSACAAVFTPETLRHLDSFYVADLERFGDLWEPEPTLPREPGWSPEAYRDIAARCAMNQRVADLHNLLEESIPMPGPLGYVVKKAKRQLTKLRDQGTATYLRALTGTTHTRIRR